MDTLTIPNSTLPDLINKLTPRQMEIIKMLMAGRSNKETASLLSIKRDTVRKHIVNACKHIGVENRIQLIVLYAQWWATEGKEQ